MTFKSIDTIYDDENQIVNFPIEFLNSLNIPGMPLSIHNLRLKIGSQVYYVTEIHQKLCNDT